MAQKKEQSRLQNSEEVLDEPTAPVLAPVAPSDVTLVNLSAGVEYVPLAGSLARLGPKQSVSIPATDITDETRNYIAQVGRIELRTL